MKNDASYDSKIGCKQFFKQEVKKINFYFYSAQPLDKPLQDGVPWSGSYIRGSNKTDIREVAMKTDGQDGSYGQSRIHLFLDLIQIFCLLFRSTEGGFSRYPTDAPTILSDW